MTPDDPKDLSTRQADRMRDPAERGPLIILTATRSAQQRLGPFRDPKETVYPSHVILQPHPKDPERTLLQTRALNATKVWLTIVEADFTPGQLRDLFEAVRARLDDLGLNQLEEKR